jgi:hypothetical protein
MGGPATRSSLRRGLAVQYIPGSATLEKGGPVTSMVRRELQEHLRDTERRINRLRGLPDAEGWRDSLAADARLLRVALSLPVLDAAPAVLAPALQALS